MNKLDFSEKGIEEAVHDFKDTKTEFKKSFLGSAGIIVGIFLTAVVILMTMADVRITTIEDFADLAKNFFLLLFVSYQIYVNFADSGKRAGLKTEDYRNSKDEYSRLRNEVIDNGLQALLPEFCAEYIERELIHTRTVIVANIGMGYKEFIPYLKLGKEGVRKDKVLSKAQKRAIIKAIEVKPIKLTPDMIMHGEKVGRSPLGLSPKEKRFWNYLFKLLSSMLMCLFFGVLAFEFVREPTWETAIFIITRLVPVILNAVSGYVFGYENIIFDTVGYMNNQSALIEEFKKYEPEKKEIKKEAESPQKAPLLS